MPLAFVDRYPTVEEVEKLRLLLSTYQDGSGGTKVSRSKNPNILSLPDYRDFERCVAIAFRGEATESKRVFDVILRDQQGVEYGLSCKMKGDDAWRKLMPSRNNLGYIHMELANASGDFKSALERQGLSFDNYTLEHNPFIAGRAVINLVKRWPRRECVINKGKVNLRKSYYLAMVYEVSSARCSLFQLPLFLPNPRSLNWQCPTKTEKGVNVPCKRIQGDLAGVKIFDYYATSGGQLKYYYPTTWPILWSVSFKLERIPEHILLQDPVSRKAELYFEEAWYSCNASI